MILKKIIEYINIRISIVFSFMCVPKYYLIWINFDVIVIIELSLINKNILWWSVMIVPIIYLFIRFFISLFTNNIYSHIIETFKALCSLKFQQKDLINNSFNPLLKPSIIIGLLTVWPIYVYEQKVRIVK